MPTPSAPPNRPMPTPPIVPVIMSGGSGTRLWPLSGEAAPKQFHALGSARTMIQETALRFVGGDAPGFAAPIVVCNARHLDLVRTQLGQVGIEPKAIVLEPFGRNTAAVAALAAELTGELAPGSQALLLPADHVIPDRAAFLAAVGRGARARDRIVTFGVEPTGPETGYGYIQRAEALAEGVYAVACFVEKPELKRAEAFLAEGGYAWNGGIFLFDPQLMLAELERHRPELRAGAARALAGARRAGTVVELTPELFVDVPAESIDTAVMERTDRAAVAPFAAGWADIGSWSELWRLGPFDEAGNVSRGEAVLVDTRGSLVWSEAGALAVVGLQDVVVVSVEGATLVLHKSRAQDVKGVVEALRARGTAR